MTYSMLTMSDDNAKKLTSQDIDVPLVSPRSATMSPWGSHGDTITTLYGPPALVASHVICAVPHC